MLAHPTSCPSPRTPSRSGSFALSPLLSRLRETRKVVGCPNQTCAHNLPPERVDNRRPKSSRSHLKRTVPKRLDRMRCTGGDYDVPLSLARLPMAAPLKRKPRRCERYFSDT